MSAKEGELMSLNHLSGDVRKFVEGLISFNIIKNQDQVEIFCKIMSSAQGRPDAFAFVMSRTEHELGFRINIYNYANNFETVSGDDLLDLF